MARLTKTEAARQFGIARSTLDKRIAQGALSPAPDGLCALSERFAVLTLTRCSGKGMHQSSR